MKKPVTPIYLVALVCLFLSGISGLIYQVVWARYLALFLGHASYAVVAVLTAFMGGLALGSLLFGKWADQTRRPLLVYAWLEAGIAVCAFLFPSYYELCNQGYLSLAKRLATSDTGLLALKFIFSAASILIPTTLMGGTLPVLAKLVTRSLGELQGRVATLYFTNSLGAVAGCVIADFWWIPSIGLPSTLLFSGAINVAVAALAFFACRFEVPAHIDSSFEHTPHSSTNPPDPAIDPATSALDYRLALVGIGVSGFAAMLYEVAWNRMLCLALGSSTHAFSIMLITFIGGIAIGARIVSFWRSIGDSLRAFAWCEMALAGSLFFSMFFYDEIPYWSIKTVSLLVRQEDAYILHQFVQIGVCLAVMFVPTVCLGMTLPLASRATTTQLHRTGRSVGLVFAVNTAGTVLGAAASGLWLMPALGLARLLALGIALNASVAIAILRRDWFTQKPKRWLALPAATAVSVILSGFLFDSDWQHSFSMGLFRGSAPASLEAFKKEANRYELRYYKDGAGSTVSVQSYVEDNTEKLLLRVNGKVDASSRGDATTQLLLGHIPLFLQTNATATLVIGLGSGMTCGAMLQHTSVTHLDVVEISPEVAQAARIFEAHNGKALDDPRLHLHLDDAKSFLQLTSRSYDVIISEPSNPWMAGVAGVFSREHFGHCRDRLKAGGIMAQWVHMYEISDEALQTILATFFSVFQTGAIWQTAPGDLVLIGSAQASRPDFENMAAKFNEPAVKKDFERIDIFRLSTLLSLQIVSEQRAPFITADGTPMQSDLYPTLEYVAQKAFFMRAGSSLLASYAESSSPRAGTLLAQYAKIKPIHPLDLRGLVLFFNSYGIPESPIARSYLHRWRAEAPEAQMPLEFLASVNNNNAQAELNVAILKPLRDSILSGATNQVELLKWYGQSLLQTYRGQRSTLFLPPSEELKSALHRLMESDPNNQRVYRLRLAELAWDRSDDAECLAFGQLALHPDSSKHGPNSFAIEPSAPGRVFHYMIETLLSKGDVEGATQLCKEAFKNNFAGPRAYPVSPLLELSCRKVLTLVAKQNADRKK